MSLFNNVLQVWNACKSSSDNPEQPNHEMDILAGHENDVNYVQFRYNFRLFFLHVLVVLLILRLFCLMMQWLCRGF